MANKTQRITIDSILGGEAPLSHFAGADQFRASMGIDPSLPINDSVSNNSFSLVSSGLLRPTSLERISSSLNSFPMWLKSNPKDANYYLLDAQSSMYSVSAGTVTGLSDAGELSNGNGNGFAYYDNYMYIAKNTTVARYGPLNGTPLFNGDFWVSTLGKASLTDTVYPSFGFTSADANHILHRHSDGKLYMGDVVDNKGVIHYIATKKTTVEGDTDNGSKYNALEFGYGLYPTAIESYGSDLAIALYENNGNVDNRTVAKIAFWDTTSDKFSTITWDEFSDEFIVSLKNVNGSLYVVSVRPGYRGYRVSVYIGGNSFQELIFDETSGAPGPGAIDTAGEWFMFGTNRLFPASAPCVNSIRLKKKSVSDGVFTPYRATLDSSTGMVTALCLDKNGFNRYYPIIAWSDGSTHGVDRDSSSKDYSGANQIMWSKMYRIGSPFKITKIRIPLAQAVSSNMIVTPTIYVDDGVGSYVGGTSKGLAVIDSTNYSGKRGVTMRPENLTGDHNFWLELKWTGSALCVVNLPILIEYELIDD